MCMDAGLSTHLHKCCSFYRAPSTLSFLWCTHNIYLYVVIIVVSAGTSIHISIWSQCIIWLTAGASPTEHLNQAAACLPRDTPWYTDAFNLVSQKKRCAIGWLPALAHYFGYCVHNTTFDVVPLRSTIFILLPLFPPTERSPTTSEVLRSSLIQFQLFFWKWKMIAEKHRILCVSELSLHDEECQNSCDKKHKSIVVCDPRQAQGSPSNPLISLSQGRFYIKVWY